MAPPFSNRFLIALLSRVRICGPRDKILGAIYRWDNYGTVIVTRHNPGMSQTLQTITITSLKLIHITCWIHCDDEKTLATNLAESLANTAHFGCATAEVDAYEKVSMSTY